MPLFTLATSKKGAGYLKHEALGEEVSRFVGITYTASKTTGYSPYRSPAGATSARTARMSII